MESVFEQLAFGTDTLTDLLDLYQDARFTRSMA